MTIKDVKICTGCGACAEICPQKCIKMIESEEGFIVPKIEESLCAQCGLCYVKCPANHKVEYNKENSCKAFAFAHKDQEVLKMSSSGGAFFLMAQHVVENGGVVFGTQFDEQWRAKTTCAKTIDELLPMMGSKYVQSITGDSYRCAKELLREGKKVLYTGTPCQIAGLYATLGEKEKERVTTIELLCHGVPSNGLFHRYLEYLQGKFEKIIRYSFRDKTKWGWGNWGSFAYLKKGKEYIKYFLVASDYFYSLYFKENNFNESCYRCPYATLPRVADITIGDFWGNEKILPNWPLKDGISVVLVNNSRGKSLFDLSLHDYHGRVEEVSLSRVIKENKTIIEPTKRPRDRDEIYKAFADYDFETAARKYCKLKRVLPIIPRYIPQKLKVKLRSLIDLNK